MERTFIEKVDDLCGYITDNDTRKASEIKEKLLAYNVSFTTNEDLLDSFKEILGCCINNDGSKCLDSAMAVAFFAMDHLIFQKNDVYSATMLTSFARDTLFMFYLEKKNLYYACVKAFYEQILGHYPKLSQRGYKDVRNICNNRYDKGFMEIDYAYITYIIAKRTKALKEQVNELDSEYIIISEIASKYEEFTSFADLEYGFKYYNRPKVIALFNACKSAPKGFSQDETSELLRTPLWLALSYAAAEASGAYYGRLGITEALNLADVCPGPSSKELSIIEQNKKKQIKKWVLLAAIALVFVIVLSFANYKPGPFLALGLLGLFIFAEFRVNGGKGSELWYIGYHYIGPAYWWKR